MGQHTRSDPKTIHREKQLITATEGILPDGRVYLIPDTYNAYGDEISNRNLAEDYVGSRSGDNSAAVAAGEKARLDFGRNWLREIAAIKRQQYFSKHPVALTKEHRDNAGNVTGITVFTRLWNTVSQNYEYREKFYPVADLIVEAAKQGSVSELLK